jgi:hypothetical protein
VKVSLPGLWAVFAALIVAIAVGSILAIDDSTAWRTTYAGSAPESALADLAAGLGLLAVGLYLGAERSGRRLGTIVFLAGAAWLSADLVGWQSAAVHVRMFAMAAALFITPLLLHVVAVAPGRRPVSRPLNAIVLAGYVVAAGTGAMVLIAVDPSIDLACWSICSANPLLLVDGPLLLQCLRP